MSIYNQPEYRQQKNNLQQFPPKPPNPNPQHQYICISPHNRRITRTAKVPQPTNQRMHRHHHHVYRTHSRQCPTIHRKQIEFRHPEALPDWISFQTRLIYNNGRQREFEAENITQCRNRMGNFNTDLKPALILPPLSGILWDSPEVVLRRLPPVILYRPIGMESNDRNHRSGTD